MRGAKTIDALLLLLLAGCAVNQFYPGQRLNFTWDQRTDAPRGTYACNCIMEPISRQTAWGGNLYMNCNTYRQEE